MELIRAKCGSRKHSCRSPFAFYFNAFSAIDVMTARQPVIVNIPRLHSGAIEGRQHDVPTDDSVFGSVAQMTL
jgi:hypothetical protein